VSPRGVTGALFLTLILAGCGVESAIDSGDAGLTPAEFQFLGEDVIDLMTVVFQAGEQAFLGETVDPGDVVTQPSAANNFAVTYVLPEADRLNLGLGSGRVTLQILEDGVPVMDPLGFTYAGSAANSVQVLYAITYQGVAAFTSRTTDVDLSVDLVVDRDGSDNLTLTDYIIEGFVDPGQTRTDISIDFRALGAPVDGIENDGGQATALEIDDPDVVEILDATADLFDTFFQVNGNVRGCCPFADNFLYSEVGL